jgi:pyruvate dehydrogenase E2 component (dihydrolipoamide acetyltransferase)
MPSEIVLPQWGMEMQDGVIIKWLKNEGDTVEEGEPLVEIETAKLQTELESTASGTLSYIVAQEGEIVPIRGVLCVIAGPGEEAARPTTAPRSAASANAVEQRPSAAATAPAAPASAPGLQVVPAARRLAQEQGVDLASVQGSGPRGRILIADVEQAIRNRTQPAAPSPGPGAKIQVVPAARRLAQERGVDLCVVQGSGPGGRILVADVEKAQQADVPPAPQSVAITGIRRTIATRMLQSLQTMAQVTLTTEADLREGETLRRGLSRHRAEGGISPLHLVIKAAARALKEHPRMNALQTEDRVELMAEVNIGVAVALAEGLITPVIRNADAKSLSELATEGRELAAKTRGGTARPEDVTGGTFTITNLGAQEIDAFTPIINPPQVGILGVGRVVEKPIVAQGQVVVGSMMYLSLTFDHRVVDGAPAADFLQSVKRLLEDPWWMVG